MNCTVNEDISSFLQRLSLAEKSSHTKGTGTGNVAIVGTHLPETSHPHQQHPSASTSPVELKLWLSDYETSQISRNSTSINPQRSSSILPSAVSTADDQASQIRDEDDFHPYHNLPSWLGGNSSVKPRSISLSQLQWALPELHNSNEAGFLIDKRDRDIPNVGFSFVEYGLKTDILSDLPSNPDIKK